MALYFFASVIFIQDKQNKNPYMISNFSALLTAPFKAIPHTTNFLFNKETSPLSLQGGQTYIIFARE